MMKNVRMSRRNHGTSRQGNTQTFATGEDYTGKAENTGLENGQEFPKAVKKHRPFEVYPLTEVPTKAAEDVDHGKEGPRHLKPNRNG